MHSTITWPSHCERCSRLPCMRWPLTIVRRLRVVLAVPVLLLIGKQRGQPQRRRIQQQFKAALVESGFVRVVHACPSAVTHANPPIR